MKKALLFAGISLMASLAQAQYVSEESYMVYQEPYIARSYGNANWSYVTASKNYQQRPKYTNSHAQAQYGQGYGAYEESGNYQDELNTSPVFNKESLKKHFYASARIGVGRTDGFDGKKADEKMKKPTGAILSLSLGGYLTSNVRMDAEFAYHTKGKLYEEKSVYGTGKLEYDQYDFGLNGYYDFLSGSKFRPFVGIGIWGTSARVHAKSINEYHDTYDDRNTEIQFAVSGAMGLAYQINDLITLEAMGRARYIFEEDIYNLEGLIGSRFSF